MWNELRKGEVDTTTFPHRVHRSKGREGDDATDRLRSKLTDSAFCLVICQDIPYTFGILDCSGLDLVFGGASTSQACIL